MSAVRTRAVAPFQEHRGLALVELAVSLALFTVIMLALVSVWRSAQETYLVHAEAAEIEQNLRAALDFMVREIRAAGRDRTRCAFDYAGPATGDCTGAKIGICQVRLGAAYPAGGCQGVFAIPFSEATATTLRIRADRNDSGTVAATASAAAGDPAEENVRYALGSGSPPCPPGVSTCLTRDDGNGAVPLVAVDIGALHLTYYPRPGYPPCDGAPAPNPCPPFAALATQQDADNIGRVRISLTGMLTLAGWPVRRTVETDVVLWNRS